MTSARAWWEAVLAPAPDRVSDVLELSPFGERIAVTVVRHLDASLVPETAIGIVTPADGALTLVDGGRGGSAPTWTCDGQLLWLVPGGASTRLHRPDGLPLVLPGRAEQLRTSPDGRRAAVLLAPAGAGRAAVHGSGVVAGAAPVHDWEPRVESSGDDAIRQVAIVDLQGGFWSYLDVEGCTWQVEWLDDRGVVLVSSAGGSEGSWYAARVVAVDLATGAQRVLLDPAEQVHLCGASPDGSRVAVVTALASDRGVVAGDLQVIDAVGIISTVSTPGVDVTEARWRDSERLVVAGLTGQRTVVGEVDVVQGTWTEHWSSQSQTCGGSGLPVAWPRAGDGVLLVREGPTLPPEIVCTARDAEVLWSTGHDGATVAADAVGGHHQPVWAGADGLPVQGELLLPPGDGPFPLYVDVHGGPVDVARPTWLLRSRLDALLVGAGCAVLRPNPRGSAGRGADYRQQVMGDLGGADLADVLAGVDHVLASYPVDGARLAVGGVSYGGYLTYVLVTKDHRFRAAVAVAPVCDYLSTLYTCNIPEYVEAFLQDDPADPAGRFRTRSPLHDVAAVRTPVLTVVGAQDECSPPGQGQMFHRGLARRTSTPSRLLTYPLEGHGVRGTAASLDVHDRVLDWLTCHGVLR